MDLINKINEEIYGSKNSFKSPFGNRQITYADFTASGKPLQFIEDYIAKHILPMYANTHTTSSITGLRTTASRENARKMIAEATGADLQKDCIFFCGAGCTGAVSLLVNSLRLNKRKKKERAVIFVGPFEHHSNILPWKETDADKVMVPEGMDNKVDLQALEELLIKFRRRPLKIGTFSAASNVTGVQSDTVAIASLLHKYNALSFWDYASAAPYTAINMNPSKVAYKDAVFFSGHKFIGGPGSPGVLIVKKHILNQKIPAVPGGGTVLYVTEEKHRYLDNQVERNEGGTPDIIGSIRLGLAFRLKQSVGTDLIESREKYTTHYIMSQLKENPNIVILGPNEDTRLPIISFMVKHGDLYLHHNFICSLLNDLFGLQTRGGCQCAGPYSHRLLGISNQNTRHIANALIEGKNEIIKPGYIRLSFPYFLSKRDVQFIVKCIDFVGNHGWKFLRLYRVSVETGGFRHSSFLPEKSTEISKIDFLNLPKEQPKPKSDHDLRDKYLEEAQRLADNWKSWESHDNGHAEKCASLNKKLRWVALVCDITEHKSINFSSNIIDPSRYHVKNNKKPVVEKIFSRFRTQQNTKRVWNDQ